MLRFRWMLMIKWRMTSVLLENTYSACYGGWNVGGGGDHHCGVAAQLRIGGPGPTYKNMGRNPSSDDIRFSLITFSFIPSVDSELVKWEDVGGHLADISILKHTAEISGPPKSPGIYSHSVSHFRGDEIRGAPKKCHNFNRIQFPQLLTETIVLWPCCSQQFSILIDKNSSETQQ